MKNIQPQLKLISCSALLCLLALGAHAESISGRIVDKYGIPVVGAIITNINNKEQVAYSDKQGRFFIDALQGDPLEIETADYSKIRISAQPSNEVILNRKNVAVQMGNGIIQTREESTASTGVVTADEIMKTSSLGVGDALYGRGLGLIALQSAGLPWGDNTDFYVRGRNTFTSNSPLILVDGFERSMNYLVREEIETVTVLKDAPALALYGLRGSNGVILITTKQGIHNTSQIEVSYEHGFVKAKDLMQMVDGPTYAHAYNEAMQLDGNTPRYSQAELDAFASGAYPDFYPNVNWFDQTLKDLSHQNLFNVTVRGGGKRVRYATVLNLQNCGGFLTPANVTDGYSSELKFSKLNLRTNLDIQLTATTDLSVKVMGSLSEYNRPGISETDFMPLIYNTPSIAMPVKTASGEWGGNQTWKRNPVAEIAARGYGKSNSRTLFADWAIKQDLSVLTPGLSAEIRAGFDSFAQYWEQVAQNYRYEENTMKFDESGNPIESSIVQKIWGSNSVPSYSSRLSLQWRHFNVFGMINYNQLFGNHKIDADLMVHQDQYIANSQHNTYNRLNFAAYVHYGWMNRYFADVAFSASGSNRLQPGHKFGYYPAVGASWLISNESFMQEMAGIIDFWKLRASWGLAGSDWVPEVNLWEQTFGGGGGYQFGHQDVGGLSGLTEQRLATLRLRPEKIAKYNLGTEIRLFNAVDLTLEAFYERRSDILCSTEGSVSSIMGVSNPYKNDGIVENKGIEVGLVTEKKWKDFNFMIGGNFTFNRNKIINQNEVYREYDYLKRTGHAVGQVFGYQAIGYFQSQEEIDNPATPKQMFSTVSPGDIKFKDQNNDGIINSLDQIALGYNGLPEIYYSAFFNFEYKGIGIDALFQGAAHRSVMLSTNSLFWGIRNSNLNISQHVYDNRWTPETPNAKFPRLTALENANNYNTNSVWLADGSFLKLRSCEVYYRIPEKYTRKIKMFNSRIFVRGNDLLTFDKLDLPIDPEAISKSGNGVYPMSRTFSVGAVIGF